MPELPEVEFARRALKRWFKGRTLVRTEAENVRTFRDGAPGVFKALEGKLQSIDRRGKYLVVTFDNALGFIGHLGMTGKFLRRKPDEAVKWSRARFHLDSGDVIHFQDPRMFGFLDAEPAAQLWKQPSVEKLGLDPLEDEFTVETLQGALGKSKQPLKVALMDQERLAGLGNIHAAEALFHARLHPDTPTSSLTSKDWDALASGIEKTLGTTLASLDPTKELVYVSDGGPNPFSVYRKDGTPCPVCGKTIEKTEHGGRSTYFCGKCQKKKR